MSCEPPPITLTGLGRVFSGPYRVELTFNDQQWTQRLLEYEYTVPWRAVAIYPSSGPLLGGTFVQVLGTGMIAAATDGITPVAWHALTLTLTLTLTLNLTLTLTRSRGAP